MEHSPDIIAIGSIFIDDIVLPTGQTYMEQLGGAAVHAAMGMALWHDNVGINAVHGNNLPQHIPERLAKHLDIRGLFQLDIPQIRAWQLFEEDGTRRELYRVKITEPFIYAAQPEHCPEAYRHAKSYYMHNAANSLSAWLKILPKSSLILWEPLQQILNAEHGTTVRDALNRHSGHRLIVSVNLVEAITIYNEREPSTLVKQLHDDGAGVVMLRMGQSGSIVSDGTAQWHIPAITPETLVDVTGAGNTYSGALLAGLTEGRSLAEAGCMGAVAASFCIEERGFLDLSRVSIAERDRRLRAALTQVQAL